VGHEQKKKKLRTTLLDVLLVVRERIKFMPDGTAPYFRRDVRGVLNSTYYEYNRGLGTEKPTSPPPPKVTKSMELSLFWDDANRSATFMEPEGSISCSRELSANPYPEPHESSLHPLYLCKINFNNILPHTPTSLE
jgi:hypothetical protein